jgi:hypothetical protein
MKIFNTDNGEMETLAYYDRSKKWFEQNEVADLLENELRKQSDTGVAWYWIGYNIDEINKDISGLELDKVPAERIKQYNILKSQVEDWIQNNPEE